MKKILSFCLLTTLLMGCGTSTYVHQSEDLDIGYGVQNKDKSTTAVSKLNVKKSEAQTYSSIYDYLRGRVPGVTVTQDNRIIIRGVGTNSDNTDPLILVDDVQVSDISGLNPADIESVDVIKDGSSAIYGMQGANGVIIIRTLHSGR